MSNNPLPVRSPLDVLRLDFPEYQITMRAIGGKLFYLAEADRPHVQPRFVQAETTGRLRSKLRAPIRPFVPASEPSIPRVYDYLLGGKDNFAADRHQAVKLLKVFPRAAELARESRQFQRRAVAYAAQAGIRQFIDLGCGLPTVPSTHETARDIQPDATVVYVDNDEQVLTHSQNILARTEGVLSAAGDLGHPDEIVYDWRIRQAVDFYQPMCLVMTMTLHFCDAATARRIAAQFIGGIPVGSYVIVSAGQLEGDAGDQFTAEYRAGRLHHHGEDDVASFMDGLELAGPGVTEARRWRAPVVSLEGGRRGHIWAGVGQKTGTAP
jgi:hypothetical protein